RRAPEPRRPRLLGRSSPSAFVQPAEVPAPRDRKQRSRDHGLEPTDRDIGCPRGPAFPEGRLATSPGILTASHPALILASASPRGRELLPQLGIPFTVRPSSIPEEHPPGEPAFAITAVALAKARTVARRLGTELPAVVLGADTEVVLDGRLLGKPSDAADAAPRSAQLRGPTHQGHNGRPPRAAA